MVLKKNYLFAMVKANINVLRDWVKSKKCKGENKRETEETGKMAERYQPRRGVSN